MYCNENRRGCRYNNNGYETEFEDSAEFDGVPTDRKVYNCRPDRKVIKHQHIIKYRHDVIHEYDVVHEHDYYYRDVVATREVEHHHDHEPYNPRYCGENGENCEN